MIGKDAKKIIDAAEAGDGTSWLGEEELKKQKEIDNLKTTID